jgi:hypothetical protein
MSLECKTLKKEGTIGRGWGRGRNEEILGKTRKKGNGKERRG